MCIPNDGLQLDVGRGVVFESPAWIHPFFGRLTPYGYKMGIQGRENPLPRKTKGDTAGVDGNPAATPLLGHVGRSTAPKG